MSRRNLWGYVCTSAGLFASFGGLHLVGHGKPWTPIALLGAALVLIVIGWRLLLIEAAASEEEPRARDDPVDERPRSTPSARA